MVSGAPSLLQLVPSDRGIDLLFGGVNDSFAADLIGRFFLGRGFVLGSGSPIAGVYETGSAVGRAVLGGFVKRQKYSVNIWTNELGTHVKVHSEMSGASGSVVGVVRERKGRDDVKSALQWHVQSAFAGGVGSSQPQHVSFQLQQGSLPVPQHGGLRSPSPEHVVSPSQAEPAPSVRSTAGSISVELARLTAMHREGQLTDAEFELAKRKLLGT